MGKEITNFINKTKRQIIKKDGNIIFLPNGTFYIDKWIGKVIFFVCIPLIFIIFFLVVFLFPQEGDKNYLIYSFFLFLILLLVLIRLIKPIQKSYNTDNFDNLEAITLYSDEINYISSSNLTKRVSFYGYYSDIYKVVFIKNYRNFLGNAGTKHNVIILYFNKNTLNSNCNNFSLRGISFIDGNKMYLSGLDILEELSKKIDKNIISYK